MNDQRLVKQDMNFLEFPLWFSERRTKKSNIEIKTETGAFKINTDPKLIPDSTDILVLYYMLHKAQQEGSNHLKFKTFQVLKDLGLEPNDQYYKRILKSLETWQFVKIKFQDCFYLNNNVKRHITKGFGILSYRHIKDENIKTKKNLLHVFEVFFDSEFFMTVKQSLFFRHLDLKVFSELKNLERRLYEWIPKQLLSRKTFTIKHTGFYSKMLLSCPKYKSEIIRRSDSIKRALDNMNKILSKHNNPVLYEFDYTITSAKPPAASYVFKKVTVSAGGQKRLFDEEEIKTDAKLNAIGLNKEFIKSLNEKYPAKTLNSAIIDFELIQKRYLADNKTIDNPQGFFISLLPSDTKEEYKFSSYYKKAKKTSAEKDTERKTYAELAKKLLIDNLQKEFEEDIDRTITERWNTLKNKEQDTLRLQFKKESDNSVIISQVRKKGGFDKVQITNRFFLSFLNNILIKKDEFNFIEFAKKKGYILKQDGAGFYFEK